MKKVFRNFFFFNSGVNLDSPIKERLFHINSSTAVYVIGHSIQGRTFSINGSTSVTAIGEDSSESYEMMNQLFIETTSNNIIDEGYDQTLPLIGSIEGSISDGASITLTVINAQAGPNIANITYDQFDGGVAEEVPSTTPTVGTNYNTVNSNIKYDPDAYAGDMSARIVTNSVYGQFNKNGLTPHTEIFHSLALKTPDGYFFPGATAEETAPGGGQAKLFWTSNANNSVGGTNADMTFPTYTSLNWSFGSNDTGMFARPALAFTTVIGWDIWNRVSSWVRAGADPDVDLGQSWMHWVKEGVASYEAPIQDAVIFGEPSSAGEPHEWVWFNVPGFFGNLTTGSRMLLGHLYHCFGPRACSRVEIGDAPAFANCTKLSICNPTSWSNTSVTFTARKGSHDNLTGKYLYLFNGDNLTNQVGYPI